jgi:hypothetical protein
MGLLVAFTFEEFCNVTATMANERPLCNKHVVTVVGQQRGGA